MRECVQDRRVVSTLWVISDCREQLMSEGMCIRPDGGVDSMKDVFLQKVVCE